VASRINGDRCLYYVAWWLFTCMFRDNKEEGESDRGKFRVFGN